MRYSDLIGIRDVMIMEEMMNNIPTEKERMVFIDKMKEAIERADIELHNEQLPIFYGERAPFVRSRLDIQIFPEDEENSSSQP